MPPSYQPFFLRFLFLALLLGLTSLPAQANSAYEQSGIYNTDIIDQVWRDTARNRNIAVRIRIPKTERKVPVILYSHGLGGSNKAGKLWGQHWASHGFIVIHLQHPGSDELIWQGKNARDSAFALTQAANFGQLKNRVKDIQFILDSLPKRSETYWQQADLNRIGLSGHSFGALTTQALAGQGYPLIGNRLTDTRLTAAIAFSPSSPPTNQHNPFASIAIPFFSVTGSLDSTSLKRIHSANENHLSPYEKMPNGDKYFVSFNDGDHAVLSGNEWETNEKEFLQRSTASKNADKHIQKASCALTLAFWNAYLKKDEAALNWLQKQAREVLNYDDQFARK